MRNDIKLINGECLEEMRKMVDNGVKFNAIIADIPYGTTRCKWDSVIDLHEMWELLLLLRKSSRTPIILFAQTPFDKVLGVSNLKMLKYEWIWEKTTATGHLNAKKAPMKAHENILVFYEKPPIYNPQKTDGHKPTNSFTKYIDVQNKKDIYNKCSKIVSGGGSTARYPRSVQVFSSDKQKISIHPTQKPLRLMEYLVKTYTNERDTVLDFTMGSGTTGLACKNLNRGFIGIELEKEYFDKANDRIFK